MTAEPEARGRRWRLAGVALIALCLAGAWAGYTMWRLTAQPVPGAAGTVFTVTPGENVEQLARKLARRGILRHAWDLRLLARLRGNARRIQSGEYRIAEDMSVAGLLSMLVRGEVVMHQFTIVPGTTFREVLASLRSDTVFKDDLRGMTPAQIMTAIGHRGEAPEGRFFADTYSFARNTPDSQVLERAYNAMQRELQKQWSERATGLPFSTPYQALIIASIIEKETAVPSERPRIAGVFVRRLQRGMHLDADPTVIYGLGSTYHGDITRADLREPTPYNTYVHRGLPPTPICMPSLASIHAAMHPAPGTALYFVAKGDGTHVFSDTLSEQRKMIRKYELDKRGKDQHGGNGAIHHP